MTPTMFALWSGLTTGRVLVVILLALLIVPFLIKNNRDGKRQLGRIRKPVKGGVVLGPLPPKGVGDNHPGTVADPAPGQPDGQADRYAAEARGEAR